MRYELDDDPERIDFDFVWGWLSTEAYWGRERTRADVKKQVDGSWRVVGAYRVDTGEQVSFARALSDGVAFAYLADVFVADAHRGRGLSKRMLQLMIDDGPGAAMRWTLFTSDAHGLYEQFGFTVPDSTAMVRPARRPRP
ncbi:GNAT family N-acetyltransferase [Microbacterium sp. NPDC057407]|uniref:GNAT family N-acetyltransferase n=1 Tax=Microbacterium sp. NPDC057407 TaxID=3346120 RepID=UPI00366EA285